VGCTHHTQAEHGPVSFTGPSTSVSCQRPRSCEPSARTARFGDSAQASAKRSLQKRSERIHFGLRKPRTRTRELWRLGCFCYATLPMSPHVSTAWKTEPPFDLARVSCGLQAKTKKAFQGIALEGLVLYECRAFRALRPPCCYRARRCGG